MFILFFLLKPSMLSVFIKSAFVLTVCSISTANQLKKLQWCRSKMHFAGCFPLLDSFPECLTDLHNAGRLVTVYNFNFRSTKYGEIQAVALRDSLSVCRGALRGGHSFIMDGKVHQTKDSFDLRNHTPHRLTNGEIKHLSTLSNVNYFNEVIDNILIPRVVGTKNHAKVFNYISSELKKLGWNVEIDEFEDDAPKFGRLTFRNIVGVLNPNADRFLVLACHYDSKYFQNEVFVGATDSAVPCAMLLNLAKVLKSELESIKDRTDVSLKLIFFDGEEAFRQWSPKDSIYGARHLASKYHQTRDVSKLTGESVSELQKIDLLVLLDLIGHKGVNFYNYFEDTTGWYTQMANAEDRLNNLRLLRPRNTRYFVRRDFFASNIEDDHLPFVRKNVPVLHLIPLPFPKEWHTPKDDKTIIDIDTVENLNMILRIFVVEYLHVSVNN